MAVKRGTATVHGEVARQKVLTFMVNYDSQHGYLPTVTEIADGTDMFRNAVRFHLERLRAQGKVTFTDGVLARTLRLP